MKAQQRNCCIGKSFSKFHAKFTYGCIPGGNTVIVSLTPLHPGGAKAGETSVEYFKFENNDKRWKTKEFKRKYI